MTPLHRFKQCLLTALAPLALALPAAAQQTDTAALHRAEMEGFRLWQLDTAIQAARRSAEGRRDFRKDERVQGWIHETTDEGIIVTFIRDRKGELVPRYRTIVAPDGIASSTEELDDEPTLQGAQARQFAARLTAQQVPVMTCSKVVEDIVMPVEGSQRIEISADGTRLLGQRDLTGDCTTLKRDANTSSVGIIEPIDTQPNEFHVYLARAVGKQLFVTTQVNGLLWLIRDGRIEAMGSAG